MKELLEILSLDPNDDSVPSLPDYYVKIDPCELPTGDIYVPKTEGKVRPTLNRRDGAIIRDQVWIDKVRSALIKDSLDIDEKVTWSGHFSQLQDEIAVKSAAIIGMCPIFPDKVTDPALLKHVMRLTKAGTEFLNPGQTPVLGADQQPYPTMKLIQWTYPEELGEDKMVLMLGTMHIEDKVYGMLGKVLRGSGWEWAMVKANIFTSGRVSSSLNDNQIKRSRYEHQVSLVAFSQLKWEAYTEYCLENEGQGPALMFEKWSEKQAEEYPMFFYWDLVMDLQLLQLRFVRSCREGDFKSYVQNLDEIDDWTLALDRPNYSRALPIHVRDMMQLPTKHPKVYEEFMKGNFVVQRSPHKFSLMGKDQSHEHSNKLLQQSGGGIADLYDKADSMALYMLSAPETA